MQRTHAANDEAGQMAAQWLQRLDDPNIGEQEMQAWLEWFSQSDRHRAAFEELQNLRLRLHRMTTEQRELLKQRVSFAKDEAGADDIPSWRRWKNLAALAASVAALAVVGVVAWSLHGKVDNARFAAPADQHRTITLEDGSIVALAAGAVVDVAYSSSLRALNVERGAAYFEVEHNAHRPFVVSAGDMKVTAVGTAFTVARATDEITVTVTEGSVRLAPANPTSASPKIAERTLRVGQRAVVVGRGPSAEVQQARAKAGSAASERADFVDSPLSEVLMVINRFSRTQVVIDDPRVADLTFSGSIMRAHVDEWIASLPAVYPVRAIPLEDGTLTLVSRREAETTTGLN